jgi:hypothetical protein
LHLETLVSVEVQKVDNQYVSQPVLQVRNQLQLRACNVVAIVHRIVAVILRVKQSLRSFDGIGACHGCAFLFGLEVSDLPQKGQNVATTTFACLPSLRFLILLVAIARCVSNTPRVKSGVDNNTNSVLCSAS